jgi:hypothetical protein
LYLPEISPEIEILRSTSQRKATRDVKEASGRRCSLHILGPFGSDSDLRRLKSTNTSLSGSQENAKKRAAVAVARKLSVLLHRLWVTGEVYDPLYNTHRRAEQEEQEAA